MTCTIYEFPQRSPEWFAARAGVFTASEFAPFYLEATTATAKKARRKHTLGKIMDGMAQDDWQEAARLSGERAMIHNQPVQRGIALENDALMSYEIQEQCIVEQVGFCVNDYGGFGCSPDGLCDSHGLEIKCHWPDTHMAFMLDPANFEEYHKFQVHGSMAVTGLREWHLWGWNPGLAPILRVVKWDSFTDRLLDALRGMVDEKNRIHSELCGMWDEWKENGNCANWQRKGRNE
jgi:hypothetical protein